MQIIKWLWHFLVALAHGMYHDPIETRPEELPMNQPAEAPLPAPPKYLWDTPADARHSVRVICDEESLTLEQKNTMTATIGGESGWIIAATHKNIVNGVVASVDNGICQWNSIYHGKEITPDEALHDPEKAVRLMCAYWKRGQRNLWDAYLNGSYKRYL